MFVTVSTPPSDSELAVSKSAFCAFVRLIEKTAVPPKVTVLLTVSVPVVFVGPGEIVPPLKTATGPASGPEITSVPPATVVVPPYVCPPVTTTVLPAVLPFTVNPAAALVSPELTVSVPPPPPS